MSAGTSMDDDLLGEVSRRAAFGGLALVAGAAAGSMMPGTAAAQAGSRDMASGTADPALGFVKLKPGADAAAGQYNRDAIQAAIEGGVSDLLIEADSWAIAGGLAVHDRQVRLRARPGRGGSPQRRPRLRQIEGTADPLLTMSGHAGSRLAIIGLDLMGAAIATGARSSGRRVNGILVEDAAESKRLALQLSDTAIRGFSGSALIVGAYHDSWVADRCAFTNCGEYGVKSLGCEDIHLLPGVQIGETGKTGLWLDGIPGKRMAGNLRMLGVDVSRGGIAFDGDARNVADGCNYFVGSWVSSVKIIDADCLGAQAHGIYFEGGAASSGFADHSIVAMRFVANSRGASGRWADVFSAMKRGSINLVSPVFSRFQEGAPSLSGYLIELSGDNPEHRVMVLSPAWEAPRTRYQGSFAKGVTNAPGQVGWIDGTRWSVPKDASLTLHSPDGIAFADGQGGFTRLSVDAEGRFTTQNRDGVRGGAPMQGIDSGGGGARPRKPMVGQQFYDSSIGKPIWCHSTDPVIWHDASGAPA